MNANLCSAAIWPEMGESAALTTGSEAESISAHFLDHLVPHPKRGKYGLYHSPTLSFLSLHCWLRAVGTRTGGRGRVSAPACRGQAWEDSLLGPLLALPQISALLGREQQRRGAGSGRPGLRGGRGGGCRASPGRAERCGERSLRRAASHGSRPAPLFSQGTRGAQHPSRESLGKGRLTLRKLCRSLGPRVQPARTQGSQGPPGRVGPDLLREPRRPRRRRLRARLNAICTGGPRAAAASSRVGSVPFVRIYGERLQ